MAHPTPRKGSIIKIRGVLDIANRNPQWALDLEKNPVKTIRDSGLGLSKNEIEAIVDIIKNTSNSFYATPEQGADDKFPELRSIWQSIKRN